MFIKSTKWMSLLAVVLLASPITVTNSYGFEVINASYRHWIYDLVDNGKKVDSDDDRREILRILMYKAQEMRSSAEELQSVKQWLLQQARVEGDSQFMRDVITTLNILIQTRRGESALPPLKEPVTWMKPKPWAL